MESKDHIIISGLVAPVAIILTTEVATIPEFILFYFIAMAAGVLIDLDHFGVYRYETGSWKDLRKALKNPLGIIKDYSKLTIFSAKKKYIAHSFTFPIVAAASLILLPDLFGLIVFMMTTHILSDLYYSLREKEFPFQRF